MSETDNRTMLNPLDETLSHQTPEPFGHVYSSDHRFFDRNWFGCYDPAGSIALITGMGAYANMNVLDGFTAVQVDGKQYNVRASRSLQSDPTNLVVGPIRHETIEPLQSVRLTAEPGEHGVSFDLTWNGTFPAHLEPRHHDRLDGRVYQDYSRFDQTGSVDGWIEADGQRFELADGIGIRDHSWGVRRSTGGFEPFTGSMPPEVYGSLFIWAEFATPTVNGHLQLTEDAHGNRQMLEGFLLRRDGDSMHRVEVTDVQHDITFHPDTRSYRTAILSFSTDDGAQHTLDVEAIYQPWAYRGTGYDRGFNDGKGLGAYRGDVVEHDVYDISHHENVILPDGKSITPPHREQEAKVVLDGEAGHGHLPIMPISSNERYGFEGMGF